jgi:muconolactone D-isomerase
MDFLVILRQDWPALRDRADLGDLIAAERRAGGELLRSGVLRQIWRVPGKRANVGVWRAEDATSLHAHLARLPLWPWLTATVVPLAEHELTTIAGPPDA